MFTKLRSLSRGKLSPSPTTETPSKEEDILSTIDRFGDKITVVSTSTPQEDNNNIRRGSADSTTSDGCMEVAEETEPTITSFTHSYSTEWERIFLKPNFLRHLRNYAVKGNLRSSRFRSVAWKLFLEVLPDDTRKWKEKSVVFRQKYDSLKDKLIINPRKEVDTVDLSLNNPLSQEDESPWNQFFLDNELRLTIKQDVIRTYPRIEFFQSNQLRNLMVDVLFIYAKINPDVSYRQIQFYHSEQVRQMMVDILFCYCREHAALSYRQGMHELLAPIIFVLHCDHQAFLHASETESLGELVREMMNPHYLEHDAYAMFSQIMETVEHWYVSKEVYPAKAKDSVSSQPFSRSQDMNPSNVIVTKLTRIQDYLLRKVDPELHQHLERLEIAPQIYGIRWIRLLFGREFPMQDLLVLWDAIFADGIGFDLVDYMFVAMLLYIRDMLLSSDYPTCLISLMRYPPVGDIQYFIDKARHIRDPHQFPRPPTYTFQTVNQAERVKTKDSKAHQASNKQRSNTTAIAGLSSLTRKLYNGSARPKTLSVAGRQKMSKSSSEPMNLQTDISPVSPGNVPQHKRGSSASMSQVEDSFFHAGTPLSTGSLSRLETQSLRSVGSTPDDSSIMSSPTKYSTLPSRKQRAKKITNVEREAETKLAAVNGQLNDKEAMCCYCASKLDIHIEKIQAELMQQSLANEDELLVAIAGIKQVRDVLKGTLRFSQNLLDQEEINISDNYYKMEVTSTLQDSEVSMVTGRQSRTRKHLEEQTSTAERKRLFYMSSEENSEAIDSPVDANVVMSGSQFKQSLEVELEDYNITGREPVLATAVSSSTTTDNKISHSLFSTNGEPSICESDLSKSWSQDGDRSNLFTAREDEEESPNPLYRIRHSSYDT